MDNHARPAAAPHAYAPDSRFATFAAALVCVLIVLMIVPEGFDYSLLLVGRNPTAGDFVSRMLWIALLSGSVFLLVWRGARSWLLLRTLNKFLIGFALLALASVVWSVDPTLTIRRDIRFLTVLMVCLAFFVTGWHERRFQNVVRPLLTVVLAGSIVFGLIAPSFGIHQEKTPELAGAWRGLTNHKNSLGAIAGVALVFWFHAGFAREARWRRVALGVLLAIACIVLSRSATSLIAAVFAVVSLALLAKWPESLRPYLKYCVVLAVGAVMLYALAILHLIPGERVLLAPVTAFGGVDTTFTGRSQIWNIVTDHVQESPLIGTGYGAYWAGPNPRSPSYAFIQRMGGFYPGTSHNGYLEIANDLGWAGLLLLFGYMFVYLKQSLAALHISRAQGVLFLTLFLQQAIMNLSESHWLSVQSVQFVLMTLATVAVARLLLERQLQFRMASRMVGVAARGAMRTRPMVWQPERHRP